MVYPRPSPPASTANPAASSNPYHLHRRLRPPRHHARPQPIRPPQRPRSRRHRTSRRLVPPPQPPRPNPPLAQHRHLPGNLPSPAPALRPIPPKKARALVLLITERPSSQVLVKICHLREAARRGVCGGKIFMQPCGKPVAQRRVRTARAV
jgi:hypothetical protein